MTQPSLLAEYDGVFSDGSPDKWQYTPTDHGLIDFKFPNGREVQFDGSEPSFDWSSHFDVDSASSRLWYNSLRYLLEMPTSLSSLAFAKSALESLVLSRGDATHPKDLFSGSLDHQIALQIRTCLTLLSRYLQEAEPAQPTESFKSACIGVIRQGLDLTKSLDLLKPNNHGVMLGIAILHASVLLPEETEISDWKAPVDKFLRDSIAEIFDDDGLANENTPSYQVFYLGLLSELQRFVDWSLAGFEHPRFFGEVCERATETFRRTLHPDGSVPAIGDSSGGRQSTYAPILGKFFSPSNGLFIESDATSHFSVICGFRSVIHKQLDDTSIRLWRNGEQLIADGGLLSYDSADPVASSIRGQLGHSGVFFKRFDTLEPSKAVSFRDNRSRVESHMSMSTVGSRDVLVGCRTVIDGRFWVRRSIRIVSLEEFFVQDVAADIPGENPVSRFLFGATASLAIAGTKLIAQYQKSWLTIDLIGSTRFDLSFGNRLTMPTEDGKNSSTRPPVGHIAPKAYQKQEVYYVEVPLPVGSNGRGPVTYRIRVGDGQYR